MSWQLRFLGTGAAHAVELGSSSAVLEHDGRPQLLIDCGPDTLDRYQAAYGSLPSAIYITHVHLDHVGGLERLFIRLWFDQALRGNCKLFMHASLVPWLQGRVADYPGVLAEGGANIIDISQTTLREFFTMIMMVDLEKATLPFDEIKRRLQARGQEMGLRIDAQHEDVFKYMHRI